MVCPLLPVGPGGRAARPTDSARQTIRLLLEGGAIFGFSSDHILFFLIAFLNFSKWIFKNWIKVMSLGFFCVDQTVKHCSCLKPFAFFVVVKII